jgi:hypothetical protein
MLQLINIDHFPAASAQPYVTALLHSVLARVYGQGAKAHHCCTYGRAS